MEESEEETNDNLEIEDIVPVAVDEDVNPVTNEEIMKEIKLSTEMLLELMKVLQKDKKETDNKNSEEKEDHF